MGLLNRKSAKKAKKRFKEPRIAVINDPEERAFRDTGQVREDEK